MMNTKLFLGFCALFALASLQATVIDINMINLSDMQPLIDELNKHTNNGKSALGADCVVCEGYDYVPLACCVCIQSDAVDIINVLTKAGLKLDLTVRDARDVSPLEAAIAEGNISTIKKLIELGVDLNATDAAGYPPLVHACLRMKRLYNEVAGSTSYEECLDIIKILLANGADKNPTGYNDQTGKITDLYTGMTENRLPWCFLPQERAIKRLIDPKNDCSVELAPYKIDQQAASQKWYIVASTGVATIAVVVCAGIYYWYTKQRKEVVVPENTNMSDIEVVAVQA